MLATSRATHNFITLLIVSRDSRSLPARTLAFFRGAAPQLHNRSVTPSP